jgi:hypothetical protein
MTDIKFKVHGKDRLLNFNELMQLPDKGRLGKITVVDLKSQLNYQTGIVTIMRKFR